MIAGFKDKDNKFHPIHNNKELSSDQLKSEQAKNDVRLQEAKELQDKKINGEIDRFNSSITDFGSGDIASAVEKGDEIGLSGNEVADLAREFADDTETDLQNVDPVATVYEHELQMARNKISEVLGYDFLNDFEGSGTEIYTAGNFLATTFDYSQDAHDDLEKKIKGATPEQRKQLLDDLITKVFLEDVDIDLGIGK